MPPRQRRLTDSDQALWAHYTRQVAPLPHRAPQPHRTPPPSPPPQAEPPAVAPPRTPRVAAAAPGKPRKPAGPALSVGTQPAGLDSGTWNRFRGGKLAVARTLDLHGMTAQRAFHALIAFLRAAHADQVRVVEIVTGRGSGETGGVIRRELPFWLNLPEIRPMILGATHPHALNPGSVRLILRRIR
ncbi:MAG TPA: Smr/MutS family protein [Rhodopila sp.]|uniref:Smr/MutS family protein n=1 Tax=Rhodopila sp. TaxID=2480087 RepID=UPI002D049CC1|nr:Smr/MutS family protein [Rhodopila sp.]HVY15604.1 Smr/MutS family protein [Rhodopila sp.]